ncbi:response regulator transcription factor [Kribbella soli]|uniref:Response regulator transcription factor n=1 Tax=Kribbella soli TaxID=1124743 RepID=A0A4V2LYH1_9ACTN|nr:response regulator transcription factor [Kribbella soli]TCC04306.1 response regulator transcription factor [Kribbella soli]
MRVLVVEDDKELQVAVPAALRSANLAVDLAVDLKVYNVDEGGAIFEIQLPAVQ